MPRHWESSRKPLFIKTIWKDGQHHVILNENEANLRKKGSHSFHWPYSKKSRTNKSSGVITASNIKVSSLKLYAGINSSDRSLVRCKTGVNISKIRQSETPSSTDNVIKRHQSAAPYKKLSVPFKYNSIDLYESKKSCLECIEGSKWIECNPIGATNQEPNILSQRVLVWLDLALQTINTKRHIKPLIERLNSVPTIQEKSRVSKNHKSAPLDLKEKSTIVKNTTDTFQAVPATEGIKTCSHFSCDCPFQELNSSQTKDSDEIEIQSLLSSFVENNIKMPTISSEVNANKIASIKRQIHIFMPDLQSKRDHCESNLLDSASSSSQNYPLLYR